MIRRPSPLAFALAAALGTSGLLAPAAAISRTDDGRVMYIVRFAEPALASYAGQGVERDGVTLAATSPLATGAAKLDVTSSESRGYLEELAVRREARLDAASQALGRNVEPVFVYDAVLNGVALKLTPSEAAEMARIPGVVGIERERIEQLQDEVSSAWVKAPELWSGVAGVATRGEGAIVGIIDSGINPSHPMFAGASPVDGYIHSNPRGSFLGLCASGQATCNNKLIGIWDFTTEDSEETDNGIDLDGHGTHVAGTAVGNPVNLTRTFAGGGQLSYQIRGVAPRANLISYKACEDDGCSGSWTLASINQAVRDGVDVINYSIGGSNVNPWNSSGGIAMRNARDAGIVIAVAAGNRGPDVSTVTSPSDAPWVMAVANATHGRRFVNRVRLTGGATAPPGGGVLEGQGLTGPAAAAPLARDPVHPLCSQGSGDLALPVTGASNPWPAGRWSGQVVVCDRGNQARVAKSNNVRLAGGSASLLLNTAAEGESVVADEHSIPTTHIGFAAAQTLLQWMSTGTGHRASIDGVVSEIVASNADILAGSSGRGPSSVLPSVIKPDLGAPGTSIQSASATGNGDATLTGTSMASPHVAGAAALLRSAKPAWRADQIISALMTTARPSLSRTSGGAAGSGHEQGSGMIDIARAVRANLSFNVPSGSFAGASASPASLNLPSMVFDRCQPGCTALTRTVTDLIGGGTYDVSFSGPSGISLTSSAPTFTLASGASRSLQFNATITDPGLYGRWVYGTVVLTRQTSDEVRETRLPVALRATVSGVPGDQSRTVDSDRGHFDTTLPALSLPLTNARFAGTRLVPILSTSYELTPDPTPSDRYDNLTNGVGWFNITVPQPASGKATRHRIELELQTPAGAQATLIAGTGGSPGSRNAVCDSSSRCLLEVEHPGDGGARVYWAMVQNRAGAGTYTVRYSVLPLAAAGESDAGFLTVTGPGTATTAQSSALRVGWQDASWGAGEVRRGAILVSAAPGDQPMTAVPYTFTRSAGDVASQVLASGVSRTLTLAPNASHERVFIDVPAGATELRVATSSASNVDVFLARRDFTAAKTDAAALTPLVSAAPPRGEALRSATGATGNELIVLANPAAGRYYATPVNATGLAANLSITATVTGTAPIVRPGAYFNEKRSGHGLFLYPAESDLAGLWYTYLQDGSTTWYYLQGSAPGANGLWRGIIFRSAWNGSANYLTAVGEGAVTPTGSDAFAWTYTLDGQTGSEPFTNLGRGCPTIGGAEANASGHWFDQARAGTGYSVQMLPNYEFYAVFAYDGRGQPRYLVAESGERGVGMASESLDLEQLEGFCPLCTRSDKPTRRKIGTMERRFSGGALQGFTLNGVFGSGVSGNWTANDAVTPLGGLQGCAP